MKKTLRKAYVFVSFLTILGLIGPFTFGNPIQPTQAANTRVTSMTVNEGYSTTLGATTNYTLAVVFGQEIPSGSNIGFGSWLNGYCPPNTNCGLSFNSASVSGLSGNVQTQDNRLNVNLTSAVPAGSLTITLNNVINPSVSGLYQFVMEVRFPDDQGPGENSYAAIFLGSLAVFGRITLPDGSAASGAGVNIRTENFSFNYGTGTNESGYYAIPVETQNGTISAGQTYFLEIWPGNNQGYVSPDPVSFVYSGTAVIKNLALIPAVKIINVTVKYNDGNPVTVANVWANKKGGGSGSGGEVDSNGVKTILVSGGSWDVGLNCPWNQQENRPESCDWMYNQPPVQVDFAQNSAAETANLTFTVIKATAVVKGYIITPNGNPLTGGFVSINTGQGGGMGSGINNGSFLANVPAGDYKVMIQTDNNNPDLASYYYPEIPVRVADNETKDLGTITMKQKTSVITGKVLDESGNGVSGVRVNTWVRNASGWSNATSGTDGTYTLYVFAGEWEVNLDNGPQSGNYISLDNRSQSVTIADNQTVSNINITVRLADAALNVKLVDANGNAISNMFGYAYARQKGTYSGPQFGSGIDRGAATIRCIGGQTYVVGTHMPPDAGAGYSLKEEVEVTVAVGETKEVFLTLLPNDATIQGFVKDQFGQLVTGLDNARVYIQDNTTWQWRETNLKPDGSFSISVRGGKKYMAGVNFGGPQNNMKGYIRTNTKPGDEFLVPENSTYTKIITLLKADTYASGIVKDPNGNPMGHVWVNMNNFRDMEDNIIADVESSKLVDTGTETNADGTFTLSVISGTYQIHSGLPPEYQGNYMPPEEVKVTVTASSPATGIVMQYRQADATLIATATLTDGTSPEMGFCHAWSEDAGFSGQGIMGGTARVPLMAGTIWHVGCDSYNPQTNKFYRSDEIELTVTKGSEVSRSFSLIEGLFTIPQGYTETFDSTVQKFITLPDGTTVSIPANTLATSGNVTFSAKPDINLFHTKDTKPINFGWDLEALDSNNQLVTTFNSNVSICISYDEDYLDEMGIDENTIVAKYFNVTNGAWQLPDGVNQDFVNDIVCFSVSHFTNFALATGSVLGAATHGPADILATPASSGGPQIIVADENGKIVSNFFAYDSSLRTGLTASTADVDDDGETEIIVAPGSGVAPQVRIFNHAGQKEKEFYAYAESLRSGIYVTTGDVNGDGTPDIVTATREGAGPQVKVFNASGNMISQFFAYAQTYRNGFRVTVSDVTGDGTDDIITVPDKNSSPQIRVFDYQGKSLATFFAYADTIRGGYNLTTGDVNGDDVADILVTPKSGMGPQVAMFTGTGTLIKRFFAFAETFRGGINVSVGDTDGDGSNDIVACPESGAGPQIRVFDSTGKVKSQFWAYASNLRGQFISFVADLNGDGTNEIITAPGMGMGPQVRTFNKDGHPLSQFFTHHKGFRGGLNMFPAY